MLSRRCLPPLLPIGSIGVTVGTNGVTTPPKRPGCIGTSGRVLPRSPSRRWVPAARSPARPPFLLRSTPGGGDCGPPPARVLHTDQWLPALDRLPPFPAIGRITGAALKGVIKAGPPSKAPGRDGWSYLDLKRLPTEALDLLALIFHAVEATGEWPEPIAHSFVAMLPKGGTGMVDDYRPIVLLSVYYRLWAKARGNPFQVFLKAAGITPPSGPRAADTLAYDLAIRMAASIAGFHPTSGLALDWSKCYDHLILDLLDTVGQRVKIPPALLRPMLAAYRQPRAVLLAGPLAEETAHRRPGPWLSTGHGSPCHCGIHVYLRYEGHPSRYCLTPLR
jgi:hypothetical protein